jgi:hypothetical protein
MQISDLQPDSRNARRRTARGRKALEASLRDLGAGRSVVIDRNGTVIAGHGTLEAAAKVGLTDVEIIQTDGTKVVAVQRTDLDLQSDPRARQLALADNRTAEFAAWNPEALKASTADLDLQPYFTDRELGDLIGETTEQTTDAEAEWSGLTDYQSEDQSGIIIKVHVRNETDLSDFAKLVGQKLTPKTKFIYYPAEAPLKASEYKWVSTDAE